MDEKSPRDATGVTGSAELTDKYLPSAAVIL